MKPFWLSYGLASGALAVLASCAVLFAAPRAVQIVTVVANIVMVVRVERLLSTGDGPPERKRS